MFKSFTAILILGGVLGMACPAFGQTGDPCKDGIQTSALQTTNIGYNKAELVCNVTADGYYFRIRESGTATWQEYATLDGGPGASININTLDQGTPYEWQVLVGIGDLTPGGKNCLSPYSALKTFTTYTCNPPIGSNIKVDVPTTTAQPIKFSYLTNAKDFEFRYKTSTQSNYTITGWLETPEYLLASWTYATTYQVSFRIKCELSGSSGWSDWSDDQVFSTPVSPDCDTPPASQLFSQVTSYTSVLLTTSVASVDYTFSYGIKGSGSFKSIPNFSNNTLYLESLEPGTDYDWLVITRCTPAQYVWSEIATFSIPACTGFSASELAVTNRAEESLTAVINSVTTGEAYQWRIRQPGITTWEELPATTATTQVFNGLKAGKTYELACRVYCDASNAIFSDWSDPITTMTLAGCPMPTIQDFEVVEEGYTKALVRSRIQADAYMFQYARSSFPGGYIPTDELSDPSIELVRLAMDDEYLLQMRVKCGNQWSPWSRDLKFHTKACGELFPSNLSATAPASGTLQFSVNQNGNYNSFEWKYSQPVVQPTESLVETRKPMVTVTGLITGSAYFWSVRASCPEQLDEIPWTDWVSGPSTVTLCDPARPSDLYAEMVTQTSARLNCSLPLTSVFEYQYRQAGSNNWLDAPSSPVTFTDISGLDPGTEYEFRCYFDCIDSQSDWSGIQTFHTLKPEDPCNPPSVQQLRADPVSTNMARVSCLIQADAYTFRYKRLTYPTWNTQATISTPSDLLTNLLEDEEYEVQCQLTCGNTNSAWSLSYYFRTEAGPCAEPLLSDLQVLNLSDSAVQVKCHFNAEGYQYRIRRKDDFIWQYFPGDEEGIGQTSGLHANTEYHIQCRVSCAGGFSAWSPELKFRTLESYQAPGGEEPPVLVDPCSTPDTSQMQLVRIGPDYATIHTTYFSEKGFQFRFRRMEDNTWNVRPAIKSPDMTATPLSPGTTYYVSMRAGCMQGISDWSEALSFTTTTACSVPTPDDLEVIAEGTNAKITCTLEGVAEYQYRFRLQNDSSWMRMNAQTTATIELKNLPSDTSIVFQVRISCGETISDWSESVTFITGSTTALSRFENETWQVYPNPVHGSIRIDLPGILGPVQLSWYRIDGSLIQQEFVAGGQHHTLRTPSSPGIYLFHLLTPTHQGVKRIVVH